MYTLFFPFRLLSGREITIKDEILTVDSLDYSLKSKDNDYTITIKGFLSEEQAKAYISNIRAGLYWLLIDEGIQSEYSIDIQKITYFEDQSQAVKFAEIYKLKNDKPIDGIIDNSKPAVFLTEKNFCTLTTYPPNVIVSTPSRTIIENLIEGASYLKNQKFFNNTRLLTALDLYSAYFKESTNNARFLTLVMALESLATPIERPTVIIKLLDKWNSEAKTILQGPALNNEEKKSLKAIQDNLLYKKEESFRQNIRNLIKTSLQIDNDTDETVKKAMEIYHLRGILLHDGALEASELAKAISDAKKLVKRVLLAHFFQSVYTGENISTQ